MKIMLLELIYAKNSCNLEIADSALKPIELFVIAAAKTVKAK